MRFGEDYFLVHKTIYLYLCPELQVSILVRASTLARYDFSILTLFAPVLVLVLLDRAKMCGLLVKVL